MKVKVTCFLSFANYLLNILNVNFSGIEIHIIMTNMRWSTCLSGNLEGFILMCKSQRKEKTLITERYHILVS